MQTLAIDDDRVDRRVDTTPPRPVLDLVVPVLDEQRALPGCVERLVAHLERLPLTWRVTIADNASTDRTWQIALQAARAHPEVVRALHLPIPGRGGALRAAWGDSDATVVAYTDVDLSTDLGALEPLVTAVLSGRSDLAIGTRLSPGARVVRGWRREALSRTYNFIVRAVARTGVSDAQCGFKAARADVVADLLPAVENDNWFFDTELLLLAEQRGLRIHEVAVDWREDPDSRVHVAATALEDLRGLVRLTRARLAGARRERCGQSRMVLRRPFPDRGRALRREEPT